MEFSVKFLLCVLLQLKEIEKKLQYYRELARKPLLRHGVLLNYF